MTTFLELKLPDEIVRELRSQGITEAFPIQEAAIPDALAGKDVLGRGPTGSGKTFTFGLPMITRLARSGASKPGRPRGLVLVPTRELAAQVRERLDDPARVMVCASSRWSVVSTSTATSPHLPHQWIFWWPPLAAPKI